MDALKEYGRRQAGWSAQRQLAQRSFIAIGNCRLATAVVAAAMAWFVFARDALAAWWLLVPLLIFIALVVWHQRVLRRRTLAERGIHFYAQGIQRLRDEWSGHGSQGDEFLDANHIYAGDLDLFGRGSLFELLSSARTAAGERMLADWLLSPASAPIAAQRQNAVRELAPKLDLREDIALLGEDVKSSTSAELLTAWGTAGGVPYPDWLRVAALGLSLAGIAALILKLADIWPPWPLILILGINVILMFTLRKQTARISAAIEAAAHHLSLFSLLVERLEGETFTSDGLVRLRGALVTDGLTASRRIKHLDRWLELLDSSDHVVLRVLGPLLLYKQQIVMAIESWRCENGKAMGRWIQGLAEFEALSSLGALHYERPGWAFPLLDSTSAAHFTATDLGHPLLAACKEHAREVPDPFGGAACALCASGGVRNSLTLDSECRLLIVSGSNMSGKSTLLRSVGLNTILAWAGAPVCASALSLTPLQVGASLRVSDSLQDNRSRFFAEISRLRQIVDLTKGPIPVLFLLDELLSGTNSHDRRIGAAGVVRGLLAANTLGLLTTHDLALTQLDQEAGAVARNVHFEDRMRDGKIEFDYHLRPGVVTHSNALELMRSIGLEI